MAVCVLCICVHMCMYVCTCACVYACVYACICVYVCMCVHVCMHMCVCINVHVTINKYLRWLSTRSYAISWVDSLFSDNGLNYIKVDPWNSGLKFQDCNTTLIRLH